MRFERFMELLQALITMTDPDNEDEVLNARNILKNLLELAKSSGMANGRTMIAMSMGYSQFSHLLRSKADFAGSPGDIDGNMAKRHRLAMALRPGC